MSNTRSAYQVLITTPTPHVVATAASRTRAASRKRLVISLTARAMATRGKVVGSGPVPALRP